MAKYALTHHAILRVKERVGIKGKGKELEGNAMSWVNSIMRYAVYTGTGEDGRRHYRYKDFNIIITENNVVITVSFYKGKEIELSKEIRDMVQRRIEKELRPLKRELRATAIKMHESEIKKYKSYNPKSIKSIQNEIEEYKLKISSIENEIDDISSLINRYGLNG